MDNKKIDAYCTKMLDVVSDIDAYAEILVASQKKLNSAIHEWVNKQGPKYRHGIKDNPNFTKFLLAYIRGANLDNINYESTPPLALRGRVVKSRRDRNGFNYGFIQHTPDDVFFHERDNEGLDFSNIYGKSVLYYIFPDPMNGEDRAEIIEVLPDDSYSV